MEAKRLARSVLADLETEWGRIRSAAPPVKRPMEAADLERIVAEAYKADLARDDERRLRPQDDDEAGKFILRRQHLLSVLRGQLAVGVTDLMDDRAASVIDRAALDVAPGSIDFNRLAQALARTTIKALQRQVERDEGDFTGRPGDPLLARAVATMAAPAPQARQPAAPGESARELAGRYVAENPHDLSPDTLVMTKPVLAQFIETLPNDAHILSIDKASVRRWADLLRKLPIRSTGLAAFKGKSIAEIVEINEREQRPTLSKKTRNRYISHLGGFCRWLQSRGHIDVNPTIGFYDRIDKTIRKNARSRPMNFGPSSRARSSPASPAMVTNIYPDHGRPTIGAFGCQFSRCIQGRDLVN